MERRDALVCPRFRCLSPFNALAILDGRRAFSPSTPKRLTLPHSEASRLSIRHTYNEDPAAKRVRANNAECDAPPVRRRLSSYDSIDYFFCNKLWPVIALGCDNPSISNSVGATSAKMPSFSAYSSASAAT